MPYRIPLFEELSTHQAYNLTVVYCSQRATDRQWSLADFLPNFSYKILRNFSFRVLKSSYQDEWRFIRFNPTLLFHLIQLRPKVIIAYEYSIPSMIALLYCILTGCDYMIWSEMTAHTDRNLSKGQKWTRTVIIPRSKGFIGTSYAAIDNFRRRGIDVSKTTLATQTYLADQFTSIQPSEDHPPTVIYAGYLSHRKGVQHLIQAFTTVIEKIPTAQLILIGEGHQAEQLRQIIRDDGLENNVTMTGFIEPKDISNYYKEGDVFVLPSLEDTFGVVATEAIASGLTLICSKYAGFSSHMTHGTNGYIIDPTDHDTLSEYMICLLASSDLRATMNANAQKILYQFDPKYVAEQFIIAIEKVINASV